MNPEHFMYYVYVLCYVFLATLYLDNLELKIVHHRDLISFSCTN